MLKQGYMFKIDTSSFMWSNEWKEEDQMLKRGGKSRDAKMARIYHPAMESINTDLKFTTMIQADFPDNKVPTLDFKG